jgi:hypothetical protein
VIKNDLNKAILMKFIKSSWTNMNIRAGKYRRNTRKNKSYVNINIEFSREEYKQWCFEQKDQILLLTKPSFDRLDSNVNYCLSNIQIIELSDNIRKKKFGCKYIGGPGDNLSRGIRYLKSGKYRAVHRKPRNSMKTKLSVYDYQFFSRWCRLKARAKHRNIPFDLVYQDLIELHKQQDGKCFYTGIPFKISSTRTNNFSIYDAMSVDRVDSNLGYTKSNIVLTINCMNVFKGHYDLEIIKKVASAFIQKQKEISSE